MNHKIIRFLKNKYVIISIIFLIILFIDSNNLIFLFKLKGEVSDLKQQKVYYQQEITKDSTTLHDLNTDLDKLEKFGRENYMMKRTDEDIFLIVDQPEKK